MVSQNHTAFKSRQEYRRSIELEEARKAGLIPAQVDKNGKEINPHIPKYVSDTPWYVDVGEGPSLHHQQKPESSVTGKTKPYHERDEKLFQAHKYRKGACTNCGSMIHDVKSCIERPRRIGARWNDKNIAPDEIVEIAGNLTYDEKRDRWNGFNPSSYYDYVVRRFELQQEARDKYLKQERIKKLEDEDVMVDEAKFGENEQAEFAKIEKRVRTTGGGSTGTVRNLRIREDTAKYLKNLDLNSAHYDPKSRSMREAPNPNADPDEQFHQGDNAWRNTGDALEFNEMNMVALQAFDRGQDVHMQAAPSQAEALFKNYKKIKERLSELNKCIVVEKYGSKCSDVEAKYGNVASGVELPRELLLGQTERFVEYDRTGRIIKGEEEAVPRSKYAEDVIVNNHSCVWGSWWRGHRWGYKCCGQFMKNTYCTGAAGIEAATLET